MINLKKTVAVSLAMIMLFSTCILSTSCKKKPAGKVVTVSEDAPWYNSEWFKLGGADSERSDVDYVNYNVVGCTDELIIVSASGSYTIPEDAWEDEDFDYNSYSFSRADYYNYSGELVKSVDIQGILASEISALNFDGYNMDVQSITADSIYAVIMGYVIAGNGDWSQVNYTVVIDANTSEIVSMEESSDDNQNEDMSAEGTSEVGEGYLISKYWIYGEDSYSYLLDITAPDGTVTRLDLRNEFPDLSIYDISGFLTVDSTHCLIKPSLDNNDDTLYFMVDLEAATIEIDNTDYSWLDNVNTYNMKYFEGIGNTTIDEDGIHCIDFENHEEIDLFDFTMCNINTYRASYLSLYSYSEDRIVLAGTSYESITGISYKDSTYILVLNRAETNPNAGKTLLTAATLDYLDNATAEAVVNFNDMSSEYFVTFTDKYSVSSYYENIESDEDTDWEALSLEAQASMSNQLAIDLIAGDGPDIILNGMDFRQLNNSDYLLDLSDYYAEIEGNYFTNVIDAAKINDKLYQMPLAFGVSGIRTDSSNVNNGQVGFTFDEYSEFVDEVCNGSAPINMGQLDFFTTVIVGMNDLFDDNGDINYDCDAFRDFAQFVKDNINDIPEDDYSDDYYSVGDMYSNSEAATYTTLSSFGSFVGWDYAENKTLLGIPSYDGRGPIILCQSSVAISAETASPDACWEFVKTLLSEEVQENYAAGACPVNTDAYRAIAELALIEKNAETEKYSSYFTPEEAIMYGYVTLDEEVIDQYMEIMASATTLSSMDAAIQKILREEMPAYFSGQKSIDEVIDIIQDKVQTYINERG